MQRYKETFEAFKKAEDEATAYYNLGCLYTMEKEYKEAFRVVNKVEKIILVFGREQMGEGPW
jgi:hypothetical protein